MTGVNSIKKGFTLIELLITITIFSIVLTAFLSLFGSVFKYQRQSLNSIHLLNNVSYITEYMTRALRMAKKDLSGDCITLKYNYENPGGSLSKIRFLNYQEKCQEFLLDGNQIQVRKSSDQSSANLGPGQFLTPSNLVVENLRFRLLGESQTDSIQPKVTFTLKLSSTGQLFPAIDFQTTISQRDLDIQY